MLRNLASMNQTKMGHGMGEMGHEAWRNRQTASDVERSVRHLRLDEAMSLASVLGVTLNQLAGIDPVEV